MKISVFEGLPSNNKKWLLVSLLYTTSVSWLAYAYHRQEKNAEKQAYIDMYRSCGHYKHPWIKNPAPVPEHVKKTDYTSLVEVPKNMRRL